MKKNIILLASSLFILTACGNQGGSSLTSGEGSLPSESAGESLLPAKDGKITLKKNNEGAEVSILHPGVQAYCDAMYEAEAAENLSEEEKYQIRTSVCGNVNPVDYQGDANDNDRDDFKPIELEWESTISYSGDYKVKWATNGGMEGAEEKTVSGTSTTLVNLLCDTVYYWKVETADGAHDSVVGSFKTKGHFRNIKSGLAYNVRDFGGKMTSSGRRTKQGLIFRGGELTAVEYDTGIPQKHIVTWDEETNDILYGDLNIRYELDLRQSGRETNNLSASNLHGDDGVVTYDCQSSGSYASLFNTGSATMLKHIFTVLGNATEDAAVYFHCWGGADRTGTIAFLLDGLLGVSYTECCMDYEFTSFDTIHTRRRDVKVTDSNGYSYDFPALVTAIKNSSFYQEGKSFSDIVSDWMQERCNMTAAEVEQLKENLLEPAA